jgi:hypothetical protein
MGVAGRLSSATESCSVTDEADLLPLPEDDFRRVRSYLAPHAFATWRMDEPDEPDAWPFPTDVISRDDWDGFMTLPTDVVLKTTSYEGTWASTVHRLASDWIWAFRRSRRLPPSCMDRR